MIHCKIYYFVVIEVSIVYTRNTDRDSDVATVGTSNTLPQN